MEVKIGFGGRAENVNSSYISQIFVQDCSVESANAPETHTLRALSHIKLANLRSAKANLRASKLSLWKLNLADFRARLDG